MLGICLLCIHGVLCGLLFVHNKAQLPPEYNVHKAAHMLHISNRGFHRTRSVLRTVRWLYYSFLVYPFLYFLWNISLKIHFYLIYIWWNYPKQFLQGFRPLIKTRVLISNCTVIPLVIPCSCLSRFLKV